MKQVFEKVFVLVRLTFITFNLVVAKFCWEYQRLQCWGLSWNILESYRGSGFGFGHRGLLGICCMFIMVRKIQKSNLVIEGSIATVFGCLSLMASELLKIIYSIQDNRYQTEAVSKNRACDDWSHNRSLLMLLVFESEFLSDEWV